MTSAQPGDENGTAAGSRPFDPEHVVSFDLETTGPDPLEASVVTSAVLTIDGTDVSSRTWLADPDRDIPAEATAVHGITTEHAREHGRPHDEVIAETIAALRAGWAEGRALLVFNAPFDLTILRRHEPSFEIAGPVVDPFVLDRQWDPYRKGRRTLTELCRHYGVTLDDAHNAGSDALATARLAWKMTRTYEDLTTMSLMELHRSQARWHEQRQRSFAEWLTSQGRDASTVSTEWPLRTT